MMGFLLNFSNTHWCLQKKTTLKALLFSPTFCHEKHTFQKMPMLVYHRVYHDDVHVYIYIKHISIYITIKNACSYIYA
jgi:hypothetical protein